MEESEAQTSRSSSEEIELLRERLRRVEAQHAEVQQTLFDQYEWTREKTKNFAKELRALRSISLEYQVLTCLWRMYQRSTGLPKKTLQEDVEEIKVSLAAIPDKNDPNRDEWLRSFLRQTHANFELFIVLGFSDPDVPQDILDHRNVRVVRADDGYSDAIRANIGLCWTSGDIHGFVISSFWPYERSIENVARFFAAHSDCDVVAPVDYSISSRLVAPTEVPGDKDFSGVWRDHARRGGLFFRAKAYKKLGRIVYEGGDAWLFATLLQFSWHVNIGQPESLIFVNGSIDTPELRQKRKLINRQARSQFYYRNLFGDYNEPTWYLPFSHSNRAIRLVRRGIDQVFLRIRGWILKPIGAEFLRVRTKLFSPAVPLLFPASVESINFGAVDKIDLSRVDRCPLTDRLPDRLLFSLQPSDEKGVVDVFYSSETSVAILSRREPVEHSTLEDVASHPKRETKSDEAGWRFLLPAAVYPSVVAARAVETREHSISDEESILAGLDGLVAQMLVGEDIGDALWIGDDGFTPTSTGGPVEYRDKRLWNEHPSLISADLAALRASGLLDGRTTENGFDLIHLAGVLQFCQRPRHLLRFLAFAVKYHRYLLISSPNLDSRELRQFGPAWCHWEPARTRLLYGVKSLRALMQHCGFEEKKLITFCHPVWQQASLRNLANAFPGHFGLSGPSTVDFPGNVRSRPGSPQLEGDYLIGLFARKA